MVSFDLKKRVWLILSFVVAVFLLSGCQCGPATFTDVLELSAQKVTLAEASEAVGWNIPVPAYLPYGYEIKEVYLRDGSVRLLISDEVIEKGLVTHTDAAGTRQRYEYQSKMEMSISWHSQGVAGGLKLPGERVTIGEASGVMFDAGDHYDLWWQPRPDAEQPSQYEMVLSASKLFKKDELVKIAGSVPILPLPEEGATMDDANTYTDDSETINVGVSQEFTISLRVTPRLGEHWGESHNENLLTLLESEIIMDKPSEPVSGNAEFHFKALQTAKTEITFTLGHGATGPVKDQKVFKVDIK